MRPRPGFGLVGTRISCEVFLYREIGRSGGGVIDTFGAGTAAEILDRNAIDARHEFLLQRMNQRRDNTGAEIGGRLRFLRLAILDAFRYTHNIADRDAPPLAR